MEFKNDLGQTGQYYVSDATGGWTKTEAPLDGFGSVTVFSCLSELVLVFEDCIATTKEGDIGIDDICFSD